MKKLIVLLLALTAMACVEEPPAVDSAEMEPPLSDLRFEAFNFETAHQVSLLIKDQGASPAKYEIYYEQSGTRYAIGAYFNTAEGLSTQRMLPTAVNTIQVVKREAGTTTDYKVAINNSKARLDIAQTTTDAYTTTDNTNIEEACIDHLYAVNNGRDFFTIDISGSDYARTDLPQLEGGGSIANALDQANGLLYYNTGQTLYAYDISTGNFEVKHTGNPFNGSYPRLEYHNGFFYMSNGSTMYKVNAETNAVVAQYNITGFVNSNSGGDLAFDSNGELYLACFSGLYKFTSIDDVNGSAEITRISAENFPFQLTSMAIDRQDRIFVGTNDANSNLIQISKEDGAYSIVKTFDRKINDLTAWKCEAADLSQTDSDNDGVIDELDDYPNDPEAAADVYTPSQLGMGSFAFEDLWPLKGDYDFNDMVISYRYTNVQNSNNELVRLKMSFTIRAVGASQHSGFGIELDVDPNLISSVSGHHTLGNNTSLNAKGLEASQSKAVIIVFNDSFNHLQPAAGANYINTDPSEATVNPFEVEVVVEFTNPIDPALVGEAPFNPFIFSSMDRSKEVHLAGNMPTSLGDQVLFGTEFDDSNIVTGKTYQDANNLPWAIHIIHEFRYPIEKSRIDQGYNRFVQWGQTGGALFPDWYGDNNGYRNTSKLYFGN